MIPKSEKVITFGTFDIFHPGHAFYLNTASGYGKTLITVVARDINVYRKKGRYPLNDENKRLQVVSESGIPDISILGDESNPYKCIEEYRPDIICFGYDQNSFNNGLNHFLEKISLRSVIITLNSFKPEIYKSSILMKENKDIIK